MTAFDAHQCDLAEPFRAANVGNGRGEHQIARVTFDCSINRVDHVQRAPRRAAVLDVPGTDVERKEFGGDPALFHALDVGSIRHGGGR